MKVYQILEKKSFRDYYGWETTENILPEIYTNPPKLPKNYSYYDSTDSIVYVEYSLIDKKLINNNSSQKTNYVWKKYPDEKPHSSDSYLVYLNDGINCPIRDVYDYDEDLEEFGYLTHEGTGKVIWKSIDGCVKAWAELLEEPKF